MNDEGLFPFDIVSFESAALGPKGAGPSSSRLKAELARVTREMKGRRACAGAAERARLFAKRGWMAFYAGRPRAALNDIERALALEPRSAVFLVWRGAARKALRQWPAAAADFTQALALEPRAATAYFGRAETYRNMGRTAEALEDALKTVALEPRCAAAWRFVAKHRATPSDAARALEDLDRSLELEPDSAEGHAWRGETLRILGRVEEALAAYTRALRTDRRYALAYVWRGSVRMRQEDLAGARKDLAHAARLDPHDSRARALLGRVLAKSGKPGAALAAFASALALDRDYAWAYHERFLLHKASGRWAAALRDLDRAAALDAKYGWLETHASARGDYALLLDDSERVLARLPGPSARVWLAKVRSERRNISAPVAPVMEAEASYDVMLGYACNILCRFCSQDLAWRKDGWMPLSAAREEVYLAYQRGCRILNLLGGEVTVYPDVIALVTFARKVGFTTIQFETNGIRLADRAFAKALAEAGLTRVSVSVHAADAAAHDHLVKAPGAFDKLLKGMDNLNELGVTLRTAFVLNRLNYLGVEEFCRYFWTKKGVAEFQFIYPLYTGDFLNHLDEMAVPISSVVPELEKGFAVLAALGCPKPPNVHNIPPCFFPQRLSQIGDWQDVGMEVLKPDGKRYQDTEQTPLYRKAFVPACAACSLRERCVGIDPVYLKKWGDAEIAPVAGVPAVPAR